METTFNLSEAQQLALEKLRALVENEQVDLILAQGPDVHVLDAYMRFEFTLIWQFGIGYAFSVCSNTR